MEEYCIIHIDDHEIPRKQVARFVNDHLPFPVHFEQFSGTERNIGDMIFSISRNTQEEITTIVISDYDIHENYDGAVVLAWAKKLGVHINNMVLYTANPAPQNIPRGVKVIQKSYSIPAEVIQTEKKRNRLRVFQTELHEHIVSVILEDQRRKKEILEAKDQKALAAE